MLSHSESWGRFGHSRLWSPVAVSLDQTSIKTNNKPDSRQILFHHRVGGLFEREFVKSDGKHRDLPDSRM